MSVPVRSQYLADLRRDARLVIERAAHERGDLDALVTAVEQDIRQAQAVLSHAADDLQVDEARRLLAVRVERSAAHAAVAKRLLADALEQHAAASRVLGQFSGDENACTPACASTVLVVDDYGDVRDLLARVLTDAGFVVRTATNGLEALIAAHEMRPGVIVMDVSMPVLDGIEATRLIKAAEATRDARIIAHTGNASFHETPMRTLFAAVLTKPATPDSVLATVQRVAAL